MLKSSRLTFIVSMLIFGSIGTFVKNIDLPSAVIVHWRTIIGSLFLILVFALQKKSIDFCAVKKDLPALIIAGVVLGGNWVFLFEAYRYTSVGVATMLYYCAPIVVFFLSPILFKDQIRLSQAMGIAAALIGMLIINFVGTELGHFSIGMVYGLMAALLYASLMIVNKFIRAVSGLESTLFQLMIAGLVLTFYLLITTGKMLYLPSGDDILLIVIVGVLHTGIAFSLYVSSMQSLSGQNISLFSYIDPASALLFAFVFLGERLTWFQILGAVLIFGGTLLSKTKKQSRQSGEPSSVSLE